MIRFVLNQPTTSECGSIEYQTNLGGGQRKRSKFLANSATAIAIRLKYLAGKIYETRALALARGIPPPLSKPKSNCIH